MTNISKAYLVKSLARAGFIRSKGEIAKKMQVIKRQKRNPPWTTSEEVSIRLITSKAPQQVTPSDVVTLMPIRKKCYTAKQLRRRRK